MNKIYQMKEDLRYEYADVMLTALQEAGMHFFTIDEYDKAREKLAEVLRIDLHIR